jgi:DNA invertase Pin-like site-specific DNA recombinase
MFWTTTTAMIDTRVCLFVWFCSVIFSPFEREREREREREKRKRKKKKKKKKICQKKLKKYI